MRHEFVNPLIEPEWNMRLLEHPEATVFHSAQWAQVLAEVYGYRPQYALFRDGENVVALVPIMEVRSMWTGRRGVSLPFSDECAPLLAGGIRAQTLLAPLREISLVHQWDYLELRGGVQMHAAQSEETGQFVAHHLGLEKSEELQARKLRDSTRRNIQRASREGVEVQHLQSLDAMDLYYWLHCRTRRRHGLPPQPLRFFHLIFKYLIEPGLGFISLARLDGRCIAGSVFLQFGSQAVYKFGASDPQFQHVRANNLVMWEGIRRLQKDKVSRLSLGRSERSDEGLLQFKRGWGGEEVGLPYYRIGVLRALTKNEGLKVESGLSQRIIRRLPIPVLRLIGSLLYRHVG